MDRERRARRRFLRLCQRHLGQEQRRSRPTSRATACSTCSTICRASARETIIEDQAKDPNSKIGNAYASFMDEAAIEAKGLTPLEPWLNQIRAPKSQGRRCRALRGGRQASASPIPFRDVHRPGSQGVRPICAEHVAGRPRHARPRLLSVEPIPSSPRPGAKYLQHLTNVLTLAGESERRGAREGDPRSRDEDRRRRTGPRAESRDANKTYNKLTLAELAQAGARLRFRELGRGRAVPTSTMSSSPSRARSPALLRRSRKTPLAVLKDQLLVRSLDGYAAYPAEAFDQENFAFYGTTLSGTPEQEARWKRGVNFTVGTLGDDVSKLYVAQLLPARDQGGGRPAGPQHHRRDGPPHRQARLDEPGDQGEGACQARRLHAEDRLSRRNGGT